MNPVSDLVQCTISISTVNYKSRVRKHVQQAFSQDLKSGHQTCTIGPAQMNNF